MLRPHREGVPQTRGGMEHARRQVERRVGAASLQQTVIRQQEAVTYIRTDAVEDIPLPEPVRHRTFRRAVPVAVGNGPAYSGDSPYGHDNPVGIVSQGGPLRVQEHERFLRPDGGEERVQHELLVMTVLDPRVGAIVADAWLDLWLVVQQQTFGTRRQTVPGLPVFHHP